MGRQFDCCPSALRLLRKFSPQRGGLRRSSVQFDLPKSEFDLALYLSKNVLFLKCQWFILPTHPHLSPFISKLSQDFNSTVTLFYFSEDTNSYRSDRDFGAIAPPAYCTGPCPIYFNIINGDISFTTPSRPTSTVFS